MSKKNNQLPKKYRGESEVNRYLVYSLRLWKQGYYLVGFEVKQDGHCMGFIDSPPIEVFSKTRHNIEQFNIVFEVDQIIKKMMKKVD